MNCDKCGKKLESKICPDKIEGCLVNHLKGCSCKEKVTKDYRPTQLYLEGTPEAIKEAWSCVKHLLMHGKIHAVDFKPNIIKEDEDANL